MDLQARRNMRFEQVERFLASNTTANKWCELNKVAESTLYKWLATYRLSETDKQEEMNALQKHRDTADWIRLTREDLAQSVALAPAGSTQEHNVAAPSGISAEPVASTQQAAAITVSINNAHALIPQGMPQQDVALVLQVVAHL